MSKGQGTGAWLNERVGNLTGSNMWRAMAYLKNGKESEERRKCKIELLAERLTGNAVSHYVNDFMRWGNEQEPHAKAAFESRIEELLTECRYIPHPRIPHFGGSPDSLLWSDTVVEFKCPQTKTHIDWMLSGGVPEEHRPQILAYLACTERPNAQFVSFDPRLPTKQQLFIVEWSPTTEEIGEIEAQAVKFLSEVDAMFDLLVAA